MFYETKERCLALDGSSTLQGMRAGVMFYDFGDSSITLTFRLEFPCSNNVGEFEALVIGLISTWKREIKTSNVVTLQAR